MYLVLLHPVRHLQPRNKLTVQFEKGRSRNELSRRAHLWKQVSVWEWMERDQMEVWAYVCRALG